ncbi:indolepyruvate ferredoxin oxidoreductase beta subunit [Pseudacidovorax sp. 1753]|uniref:indolepyruvate oxidoreductase subunit beta family protein n=1 Tax=Pseudacidovorax sp. 1753 TaxID=3156419 RepID=UPI003390BC98
MSPETANLSSARPIKIAILAMGGEGGGVLADWIVDAAEAQGFYAQSTSVPGVAQRTGATIYYVEVLPALRTEGREPFFGLMPTPGDVDVVIASELMESARAVQRGLVTPDKTLLITSSHRVYAMPEKMAMGDGRADAGQFTETGRKAAQRYVSRDFAALAERSGSVISATLFGALAAAGVMPWNRGAFQAAIERGGVGVAASLKAFEAGHDAFLRDEAPATAAVPPADAGADSRLASRVEQVRRDYPAECVDALVHGLARTADYQDLAYADDYLARLAEVRDADRRWGDGSWRMTREAARYLALWMTFEDTARVAELKLRKHRFERVRREVRATEQQLMHINEYFHPRVEEIADTLPASMGRWLLGSGARRGLLERLTREGRVIRTSALGGFLMLYAVAGCRRFRRSSLRYERENAAIEDWLARICRTAPQDYALACEIVECQRLIKGYGDTHARGAASYALILSALDGGAQDAARVRRLREAALADESGAGLRALLGAAA